MRPRRVFALFAPLSSLAAFLLAPALVAQVRDSTPFHKGQWGVDFFIGSGFAGAGAVHFTSPTRATLIDLSGGYNHGSTTNPATHGSTVNVSLGIGRRGYHSMDPHVYRWTTLGVSLLYNRQSSTQGTFTQTNSGLGGGVFANLGGTWLVTPHLGLGAQWQVDLTYIHGSFTSPISGTGTSDIVTVELARVALIGQFYF